jgi:putative lipoic acid-binding regulatory protein
VNATDRQPEPDVSYPCRWRYQIVGADETRLREAIALAVASHEHTVTFSRSSRTGKYCSLHLELTVADEAHRNGIFEALREHRDVRMVL